jgi:hypothetical protein
MIISANLSLLGLKPFNPILGETFQTRIGKSEIYMEQTSHHPPIFTYQVINPKYSCFGHKGIEASTGANSVTGEHIGKMYVQFNDGNLFKLTPGKFTMTGLTVGKRYVNFESFLIEDLTNSRIAFIRINPDDRSSFSKMFTSKKTFPDYFVGFIANVKDTKFDNKTNIYKLTDNKKAISNLEGEWSSYINIDGKTVWKQVEMDYLTMERMSYTLPSDSTFREDILLFKNGHVDLAQEAKTNLEEKQRSDRKLRAKNDS